MANIQRARDAFRNMGHLRFWGGATAVLCFYTYFNGRPDAMDLAQELRRMGEESGDQHAYAWGTAF